MENRLHTIMKASIIGIVVNAFLAAFKIIIGTLTGSIAIMLDGVNNLSDSGSSLITILGTALAAKPADKKHPFGYGRMEYLSSLVISAFIFYAGITSLIESLKSIIHPDTPDYSTVTLIIVAVAIVVKLSLAIYTHNTGKRVNADTLIASGKDALMDVALSTTTLIAAFCFILFNLSLEAYLGAIISIIIIKAGIELLGETVSKILGEPADIQIVKDVKKTIASFEGINGVYDLVLNNYGPDSYMASVHIDINEDLTANEIDKLTRDITDKVRDEHGIILTAIGIYSKNTSDPRVVEMLTQIRDIVLACDYILAMHGFYVDNQDKKIRFDLVVSLDTKDRIGAYNYAISKVKEVFPDYDYLVGFDIDFNEVQK